MSGALGAARTLFPSSLGRGRGPQTPGPPGRRENTLCCFHPLGSCNLCWWLSLDPGFVWFCLWQTTVQFNTFPLDSLSTLTEVCPCLLLYLEHFGVSTRAKHPSSLLPSGLLLSIQTEQHPQQPPWNGPIPASPNNCTGFNVLIAHFL